MELKKKTDFIVNIVYFGILTALAIFGIKSLFFYFLPFILGFLVACLSRKIGKKLSNIIKPGEKFCSVAVLFVFLVIFISLVFILFRIFAKYGKDTVNEFGEYIKRGYGMFENILSSFKTNSDLYVRLREGIGGFADKAFSYFSDLVAKVAGKIPSFFLSLFVTVLSSYYITRDYDKLLKFIYYLISEKRYNKLLKIKNVTYQTFKGFMGGYFKLFLITFFELTLGFFILKIPYPVGVALLVAAVDILPVFGTGTVLIPWAVISFINKNVYFALGISALYLIVTVIRNFLEPHILGKQFDINPIFTLLFIFLGYKIGGLAGVLLLPFFITVFINYYVSEYRKTNNQ